MMRPTSGSLPADRAASGAGVRRLVLYSYSSIYRPLLYTAAAETCTPAQQILCGNIIQDNRRFPDKLKGHPKMPLHCDIFYVAGVVPRAAGNPPVCYQLRPIPGKALISAAPAGDPGRLLRCPLSPVSGVLSVCCTAAMAVKSCVLLPAALSRPSLPQPAALRISLRPHRNRFPQPVRTPTHCPPVFRASDEHRRPKLLSLL